MRLIFVTVLLALFLQGCVTPPLHQAVLKGDQKAVNELLEQGAKVDQTDGQGHTALYFAAEKGSNSLVKLLLAKGADPTHRSIFGAGNTPMHIAAKNGHDDVLQSMLKANITPDVRNRNQQTPLMLAAWARLPATVTLLLSRGANTGLQDENGWTALHTGWNPKPADADYEEVMELLIKHKAPVNHAASNPIGYTPLMAACKVGSLFVVKLLVEADVEINAADRTGVTAYAIAVGAHNKPIVSLLTEHGAITRETFYGTDGPQKPAPEIPLPEQ